MRQGITLGQAEAGSHENGITAATLNGTQKGLLQNDKVHQDIVYCFRTETYILYENLILQQPLFTLIFVIFKNRRYHAVQRGLLSRLEAAANAEKLMKVVRKYTKL